MTDNLDTILQNFDEYTPLLIELNGQWYKLFREKKYWNIAQNKPYLKYITITGSQNLLDIINNCRVSVIKKAFNLGVKFEFTNDDFLQIRVKVKLSAQWCLLLAKLIPNIDLVLLLITAISGNITRYSEIDLVVGMLKSKGLPLNSGRYALHSPAFLEIMLNHGFFADFNVIHQNNMRLMDETNLNIMSIFG